MKHEAIPASGSEEAEIQAAIWKSSLRDYGLLLTLLVIMAFFYFLTGGISLRPLNLTNLILQNSYVVIMALGMLLIIVAFYIDLSIGSVVGFVSGTAAMFMVGFNVPGLGAFVKLPWEVVVPLALMLGGLIGCVQGYFVAYAKIPSFIVTLAGMLVFRGLTGNMLMGQFVGPFDRNFQDISAGFLPDVTDFPALNAMLGGTQFHWGAMTIGVVAVVLMIVMGLRRWRHARAEQMETEPLVLFIGKMTIFSALILFITYRLASYKGLPEVLVIMAVLILIYAFVTTRTTIGRRIYAIGGNRLAAELSGIRTDRLIFLTFVNMGALAALAGLIVAARLNSATPSAGLGFELDVIAACYIGGASAYGGVGKVMGVVVGAFVMGVMNNGMSIYGLGIYWQQVVKGLVLLSAVYVDLYQKSKE
ncbi:MAG: multiple monosaccharide ABC transporter permease [Xanthobacteraceae bacterium]